MGRRGEELIHILRGPLYSTSQATNGGLGGMNTTPSLTEDIYTYSTINSAWKESLITTSLYSTVNGVPYSPGGPEEDETEKRRLDKTPTRVYGIRSKMAAIMKCNSGNVCSRFHQWQDTLHFYIRE